MMVASQNGWRANDRSVIVSIDVPGGRLAVRSGPIGVIFQHLATRFHNEVEGLVWPGNWGYAERPIRGGTQLSNHASGTAIDLNAPRHPLGTAPTANYSGAQIAKIHEIVDFYEGIIRWGGDYVGRKDGMHFEINDGVTEAQVARIAEKVAGVPVSTPAPAPAPAPAPPASNPDVRWIQERLNYWGANLVVDGVDGPKTKAAVVVFQKAQSIAADGIVGPVTRGKLSENRAPARPVLRRGTKGQPVRDLQAHLKRNYSLYAKHLVVDGDFGPATEKVVREFQRRARLTVDGVVGPATYRALGI